MSVTPNIGKTEGERHTAFAEARSTTDLLFGLLPPQALYERPVPERHRLIFYLGHLEAFDYNLFARQLSLPALDRTFDSLFAFGIDPGQSSLPNDHAEDWPSAEQVGLYVRNARARIDALIDSVGEDVRSMALEHRLMHAETLCYLLHNLPYSLKRAPVEAVNIRCSPGSGPRMVPVPAGMATLGAPRNGSFAWDNEYAEHCVFVPSFLIESHKVTNGAYLEFVRAGARTPRYWTQRDGQWFYKGMFAEEPLPLDAPVMVSWNEAQNYASWRGRALPSEEQFHRAAYGAPAGERRYPWGEEPPSPQLANVNFSSWDPAPVYANPAGDSAWGVSQLAGNGWEWTSTVFGPFDGFIPHPDYPGYSAEFFDGHHYVLKGGSHRTAARLLRRSFRNWFRPEYRYAYTTFRCVAG